MNAKILNQWQDEKDGKAIPMRIIVSMAAEGADPVISVEQCDGKDAMGNERWNPAHYFPAEKLLVRFYKAAREF